MSKWKGNEDKVKEMQIGEPDVKKSWDIEGDSFSFKTIPDDPNET